MEKQKLVELYPRLYHMAERGTWESIKDRGLLSASAVLDLFGVTGKDRAKYETQQRAEKMDVLDGLPERIVLRDQKPMPRERLLKALDDGITPEEWYHLINSKVFFWAQEERLFTLLNARDYRKLEHDVLTINTKALVEAYADSIWLCHMNSGNTWPMPHKRGAQTFRRIDDFPTKASGLPIKHVVELVVDGQVPDIEKFVVEVRRMQGSDVKGKLL